MIDALLLADWIEGLGAVVLALFWIVKAFLDAKSEQKAKREAGEEAAEAVLLQEDEPVKQARGAGAEMLAGGAVVAERPAKPVVGRSVDTEVDDFLRRLEAEQKRATKPPRETPPPQREPKPKRPRRLRPPTPSPAGETAPGDSLEEHVRRKVGHLRESTLAEQASHLGERIAKSDDRMAARLQKKFDHQLGKLKHQEGQADSAAAEAEAPAEDSAAEAIAAMLSEPQGVRNAVLLNEILKRPIDRW